MQCSYTVQGVGLTLLARSLFVNRIPSIHFSTVVSTGWRAGIDYKRAIFTGWRSGKGRGDGWTLNVKDTDYVDSMHPYHTM